MGKGNNRHLEDLAPNLDTPTGTKTQGVFPCYLILPLPQLAPKCTK